MVNKARQYMVYIHITPSNKRYVGITCQTLEQRWRNGKGYKENQPFSNAIKKYGWENISHILVAQGLSYDDAGQMEKDLIQKYKTTDKHYGYNVCNGGEDGWVGVHHTEEAKRKMSESKKGMPSSRKGCHLSDETKRKLSESHKGKYRGISVLPKEPNPYKRKRNEIKVISHPRQYDENGKIIFSEEHKNKISQALKGIQRSEEVRNNMSKAQVKTKKPVRCIDTGEIFESETMAMKSLGIDKCLIGRACKGKQKTAKGLRFEYV